MKDEKTRKDDFQKALGVYAEAMKEFRKGRFDKAAELFRAFIDKYPGEREIADRARTYLAICAEKLKEPKETVVLKTAADYLHYAVFKTNSGEREEARKLLERALKIDAENARIHYLLAALSSRAGEFEAALESLRRAIQLDKFFRVLAQNEADFHPLWDDKKFKGLTKIA
jgi:tetratricopeptide (TPR) repeat protein